MPIKFKSRLSSFADIHDPHTLELNTSLDLAKESLKSETDYYLFLPKSLKVSEMAKQSLAQDFQIRMRLSNRGRESKLTATLDQYYSEINSILSKVEQNETTLEQEVKAQNFKKLCQKVGILIGDWCTSHQTSVRKRLANAEDLKTPESINKLLKGVTKGLSFLEHEIERVRELSDRSQKLGFRTGELLNQYLSQRYLLFIETLSNVLFDHNWQVTPIPTAVEHDLQLNKERLTAIKSREAKDPRSPSLTERDREDQKKLEERLIMLGYLKKFFQSESFIELKEKKQRERVTESIAIFSALLAGFVAAVAAVFLMKGTSHTLSPESAVLGILGSLAAQSIYFIISFSTVVYIFRDRLKEQSKKYLAKRLQNFLPDIQAELATNEENIGEMKSWLFINPDKGVPDAIAELRRESILLEAENFLTEDIIYLKRVFSLRPAAKNKGQPKQSLHDIVRFNFHRTFRFMDNPIKPLSILREDGTIEKTFTSRNYLAYLIVDSKISSADGENLFVTSRKVFRIVVNKEGLQRLELVRKTKQKNTPLKPVLATGK